MQKRTESYANLSEKQSIETNSEFEGPLIDERTRRMEEPSATSRMIVQEARKVRGHASGEAEGDVTDERVMCTCVETSARA